ncbi:MAG: diguanylate cyclase [Spirochaetes bacterium]|nr:diguanylate cyclase [Spirochaetota bacterium]
MVYSLNNLSEEDYKNAIEIKPDVYWVGSKLENDDFQCHPYLIANGENSILIDPGSVLTFKKTLKKIETIIPFGHIKYFICHHQDPDITGALGSIDSLISRNDAVILTHWRAIVLLKHLGLKLPLQCIEKMGWVLDAGNDIVLKFIFSPYLHFPGAFTTYFESRKILFSSDIFGAISPDFQLVAQNENCYEGIRFFHEHYMPSREILLNFLNKLEGVEIDAIVPQHGSIIPRQLIPFVINRLKETECGIYTLAQTSTKIVKLLRLNRLLSDVTKTIILSSNFNQIVSSLIEQTGELLNIEDIFFVSQDEDGEIIVLGKDKHKADSYKKTCKVCHHLYGRKREDWITEYGKYPVKLSSYGEDTFGNDLKKSRVLLVPLFNMDDESLIGLIYFSFEKEIFIDDETEAILQQLMPALSAALERELINMHLDKQKNHFYQQSIKDSLTGLYSRFYMQEMVDRFCRMQDRDDHYKLGMIYFDIDNFKSVNDTYGHSAGDIVLKNIAKVLLDETRGDDIQVRLGGEELAVIFLSGQEEEFGRIGNRIRKKISELDFSNYMIKGPVTVSGGVSIRAKNEPIEYVFTRADQNLYKAKNSGKNKIICS